MDSIQEAPYLYYLPNDSYNTQFCSFIYIWGRGGGGYATSLVVLNTRKKGIKVQYDPKLLDDGGEIPQISRKRLAVRF